jgi:DNA-binding IclR family transcriptional regulator
LSSCANTAPSSTLAVEIAEANTIAAEWTRRKHMAKARKEDAEAGGSEEAAGVETSGGDYGGVQSIENGARLLVAMAELGPAPMLKMIAAKAGMPPAKAHRYLVSFSRTGLVERDVSTGRYRLGRVALQIGLAAMVGLDVVREATPELVKLRDEIGQTVAIAIWGNSGPTFVRFEEVIRAVTVSVRTGSVVPLLTSATGQVFLAHLPRSFTDRLVRAELKVNRQSGLACAITRAEQVDALIGEVRRHGVGRVSGDLMEGINSVSAPIFDHNSAIVGALTALGPSRSFDVRWEGPIAGKLRATAERISASLGFVHSTKT